MLRPELGRQGFAQIREVGELFVVLEGVIQKGSKIVDFLQVSSLPDEISFKIAFNRLLEQFHPAQSCAEGGMQRIGGG